MQSLSYDGPFIADDKAHPDTKSRLKRGGFIISIYYRNLEPDKEDAADAKQDADDLLCCQLFLEKEYADCDQHQS